ncbi:MAG: AtpZ/AtpI family protein [Acidobacteriaceae bacterium]|nr:AtpZ/AtpI family protein [Acidobacteriaceae bacterium]
MPVAKTNPIANLEFSGKVRLAKSSRPDKSLIFLGKYLSLALTLPASVFAGYILGSLADHWLHAPILKALGILLGMAAGIYQIVRELSREMKPRPPSR